MIDASLSSLHPTHPASSLPLQATDAVGSNCTALNGFTAYLTWDFGVATIGGIASNVSLINVSATDNKNAGVLMLVTANMTFPSAVTLQGGVMAGRTSPDVCNFCNSMTATSRDSGCPTSLAA